MWSQEQAKRLVEEATAVRPPSVLLVCPTLDGVLPVSTSIAAAMIAFFLVPTSASASVDCDLLKKGTAPFQITSEETLAAQSTPRTIAVVEQVHRGQNGVDIAIASLPGRKRKTTSRYGIDVDRLLELKSGRSLRMVISNVPDKDMLGGKHDFSLNTSVRTTRNNTEVPVTEAYHYLGEDTFELSGCPLPVLDYSVESSLMATHTDFAYSPDLRVRLRWKETSASGGPTETRALDLATSFEPLPEPAAP